MFSVALPLTLGAISPAAPAASVHVGRGKRGFFSPEEDRASFAVRAIDNAEPGFWPAAYGLTTGSTGTFRRAAQALRIACRALSKDGSSKCSRPPASPVAETIPHCSRREIRRETRSELLPMCPFLVQTVQRRWASVGILHGTLQHPFEVKGARNGLLHYTSIQNR